MVLSPFDEVLKPRGQELLATGSLLQADGADKGCLHGLVLVLHAATVIQVVAQCYVTNGGLAAKKGPAAQAGPITPGLTRGKDEELLYFLAFFF